MRRLESPGASIATLIILFPIAAGFAVAAAIGAGGSAWLALALGAVVGAVAGCTLALRRWNDPYVGGSIRGGIGAGVIGGIVVSYLADGWLDAQAVALQPNGAIVAAGGGAGSFVVARYRPDGRLDATFGDHGQGPTTSISP